MNFKIYLLALTACMFSFTSRSHAQTHHKTENVVVILIDGYRWQELFTGADFDLLTSKKFNQTDSLQRMKKYWSDNINKRREELMPFTWKYIEKHGQIYGNRTLGNRVNVKNPYWISYPGRAEILSGYVDTAINSNSYPNNPNPNVLELINKQKGYNGRVATFACWDATGRCLNQGKTDMLINVPWQDIKSDLLTDAEILANEVQHNAPKTFGDGERLDFEVYALAKSYVQAKHPKVIYIDFGDTDEYGHAGEYDHYLEDIYNLDAMIGNLWKMMQGDNFYKDKTTFLIVPDHGRGTGDQWTSHGVGRTHSNEAWFMVLGPDTAPTGEMKTEVQIFQDQYAQSIAQLLGMHYIADRPVGKPIESIMK